MSKHEMAGEPYRPSNGTDGLDFQDAWCERCEHDAEYRNSGYEHTDNPCMILGRAMCLYTSDPDYPSEWTIDDNGSPICTAFEPEHVVDPDQPESEQRRRSTDRRQRGLFE